MEKPVKSKLALAAMTAMVATSQTSTIADAYLNSRPKPTPGTGKRARITGRDNGKMKLKTPRNAMCPCGKSGLKYKNCCGKRR